MLAVIVLGFVAALVILVLAIVGGISSLVGSALLAMSPGLLVLATLVILAIISTPILLVGFLAVLGALSGSMVNISVTSFMITAFTFSLPIFVHMLFVATISPLIFFVGPIYEFFNLFNLCKFDP